MAAILDFCVLGVSSTYFTENYYSPNSLGALDEKKPLNTLQLWKLNTLFQTLTVFMGGSLCCSLKFVDNNLISTSNHVEHIHVNMHMSMFEYLLVFIGL